MNQASVGELWTQLGSAIAGLMFAYAMFQQYFPHDLRQYLKRLNHKVIGYVYPYIQITFHELSGDRLKRSEVYTAIQTYLSVNSSTKAKRFKADVRKDSESFVLSMDDYQEVTDEFQGIKVWWSSDSRTPKTQNFSFYPTPDEKRSYRLTFHRRHRDVIMTTYLPHVMAEGKAIAVKKRQRKLYTNNPSSQWYGYKRSVWSHMFFEHPATFDTIAMEPQKKQQIKDDLIKFTESKDYYAKIGKAWKRGYLLHGPPGTGKSSMIAAMANLLDYDIYDVELTSVKSNTDLRKLLIETSNKSIIVIEDIDCSLDLTGQRKKKEKKDEDDKTPPLPGKDESDNTKVTLSGLLNFIDGLWSSCGGERLIVFTTNFVEKLDPALIRRGRMDKHIELGYCCFEAFKILAGNYLDIDSHDLYAEIEVLLKQIDMTPADVAENLMPKSPADDAKTCLENLIKALGEAKEAARLKAEEEAKLKKEEEDKEKNEAKLKKEEEDKEKNKADKDKSENGKIKEEEGSVKAVENGVMENGSK